MSKERWATWPLLILIFFFLVFFSFSFFILFLFIFSNLGEITAPHVVHYTAHTHCTTHKEIKLNRKKTFQNYQEPAVECAEPPRSDPKENRD
jgi:hypothetical protein